MAARALITLFTAGLLWAEPAHAADTPGSPPSATPAPMTPGEQARQGLDLLMKALEGWVRQVPLFAPPEVTPEGDIIIRRLDRNRPPPPPPETAPGTPPAPGAPGGSAPGSATDL
ncbi:hypothetical protein [Azospirillum soli]|uniref:hypothetical protein n=1 Tax=Azospirillum soli TaxID=1304799 RepID=UPI001AE46D69|nr:hypothetical protein [Azospirillum soli]MBP2311184.1 hypothetical protein [Azospirillum soli]